MADFTFTGSDNIAQGNNKDVLDNILATFGNYKIFPKVIYTNPVSTIQMNASISQVKQPVHNNVYFIFDYNGNCQYIGVKENMTGINNRLKLHMIENNSAGTKSCITLLLQDLLSSPPPNQYVYYITYSIEPKWMATAVESYFIDFFRQKQPAQARWVGRK
jgi:hypothetical protein